MQGAGESAPFFLVVPSLITQHPFARSPRAPPPKDAPSEATLALSPPPHSEKRRAVPHTPTHHRSRVTAPTPPPTRCASASSRRSTARTASSRRASTARSAGTTRSRVTRSIRWARTRRSTSASSTSRRRRARSAASASRTTTASDARCFYMPVSNHPDPLDHVHARQPVKKRATSFIQATRATTSGRARAASTAARTFATAACGAATRATTAAAASSARTTTSSRTSCWRVVRCFIHAYPAGGAMIAHGAET